jgi:hypothetical protein
LECRLFIIIRLPGEDEDKALGEALGEAPGEDEDEVPGEEMPTGHIIIK